MKEDVGFLDAGGDFPKVRWLREECQRGHPALVAEEPAVTSPSHKDGSQR
jgi:hypothetical protein